MFVKQTWNVSLIKVETKILKKCQIFYYYYPLLLNLVSQNVLVASYPCLCPLYVIAYCYFSPYAMQESVAYVVLIV